MIKRSGALGTQYEKDAQSAWSEVCKHDPYPPIQGSDIDRNAYLVAFGYDSYEDKLLAIRNGISRKKPSESSEPDRSVGIGMDCVRFPTATTVHAGDTKSNPRINAMVRQARVTVEAFGM